MITEEKRKLYDRLDKVGASIFGIDYAVIRIAVEWLEKAMLHNEEYIFDEPCDGCGSYDIYAIANVDGVIMAEFIRNSTKSRGLNTHELSTKGTESPHAMLTAIQKYMRRQGVSKIHPEWSREKTQIVLG